MPRRLCRGSPAVPLAPSSSPCPAGAVTEVKTDIYVTSFGPVSDVEMVKARLAAPALLSRDSLRWHLS